jgi:hypothetical protein
MTDPELELTTEDRAVAALLEARLPQPSARFRSTLRSKLASLDPGYGHRPRRLAAQAGVLIGTGALLLLLGFLISSTMR